MRDALSIFEKTIVLIVRTRLKDFSPALFQQLCMAKKYEIESSPFYSFMYPQIDALSYPISQGHGVVCDIHVFRKKNVPIQVLVHVDSGKIYMIETFCVDSSPLPSRIDYTKIEVEYHKT